MWVGRICAHIFFDLMDMNGKGQHSWQRILDIIYTEKTSARLVNFILIGYGTAPRMKNQQPESFTFSTSGQNQSKPGSERFAHTKVWDCSVEKVEVHMYRVQVFIGSFPILSVIHTVNPTQQVKHNFIPGFLYFQHYLKDKAGNTSDSCKGYRKTTGCQLQVTWLHQNDDDKLEKNESSIMHIHL